MIMTIFSVVGIIAAYAIGWYVGTWLISWGCLAFLSRKYEIGALVIANSLVILWSVIYAIVGAVGLFLLGGWLL